MAEFGKTKRPPGRPVRSGPFKDPRIDSTPPPFEEAVQLNATPARTSAPRLPTTASRPPAESIAVRVAGLEEELDRVRAERAEEADQIAEVLVRIAEVERARTAALERVTDLEEVGRILERQLAEAKAAAVADASLDVELQTAKERCAQLGGEVERTRGQMERAADAMRRAEEAAIASARRADLAEQAASDAANSLSQAHRELAADKARLVDMEAKLAKLKREQVDALEAERRAHSREMEALRQRDEERARAELESVAAMDRLRAEHTKAIEGMAEEHTLALERATAAHERDLATLDEKHTKELAEREAKHASELAVARKELAQKREISRQLEEERSANARLKQQVAAAEGGLGAAREATAKAAQLLEDLERREEMAAGVRAKSIADAKAALGGAAVPRKTSAPSAAAAPVLSLDDIEMDLPE